MYQIERNKKINKYIPETFLELNDIKDHIRYFCNPFLFHGLILEQIEKLNFDLLNQYRIRRKIPEFKFSIDHKKYSLEENINDSDVKNGDIIDFKEYINLNNELRRILQNNVDNLQTKYNNEYFTKRKIERQIDNLNFLSKRICIIIAKAGQGKTNFLCDLVNTTLSAWKSPFIFVNGYDLDATNIENSLLNQFYPISGESLESLLKKIDIYCLDKRSPFILIIDGINENKDNSLLESPLERLTSKLLMYQSIKIIITCRYDYYKRNFQILEQVFCNDVIVIDGFYNKFDTVSQDKLMNNYFHHFGIKATLTNPVKKEFSDNLLLFRLFCEVNSGNSLGVVSEISDYRLFGKYCEKLSSNVGERLRDRGFSFSRQSEIMNIVMKVIAVLIEKEYYENIPLRSILDELESKYRDVFFSFLDENLLITKTINSDGINNEVVNFTFDSCRDYLISLWLIDNFNNDQSKIKQLIINYTKDTHRLSEGIRKNLFLITKNQNNSSVLSFIKGLSWYELVFFNLIFYVEDGNLTSEDVKLVLKNINRNSMISINMLYRYDLSVYKLLNTKMLIDELYTYGDDLLESYVKSFLQLGTYDRFYSYLDKILSDKSRVNQVLILFQFILIISVYQENARKLFKKFEKIYTTESKSIKDDIRNNSKSARLKDYISNL
ncbi:MAG: hypothetical protein K6G31_05865 [Paludibacteraceae bacterium]|nr:hypothetical protein [Paludibacteraceae bacterium]